MTQRRLLEQRAASLAEIGEIMRSMKSLAFMETRKLARLISNQRAMVAQIDAVAADFLAFHPNLLPVSESAHPVYLLVGSRRGFCGDFNESLVARWRALVSGGDALSGAVIAVGQKLCRRLNEAAISIIRLDGADVANEIPAVLAAIVAEVSALLRSQPESSLTVLWHHDLGTEPSVECLLPPFQGKRTDTPGHAFAPILNQAPEEFLLGMVEQYLFAALQAIVYQSLYAENERRVRHLEGAVHHLEERSEKIQRRLRALRQEEIIEEIEVILLNAADLDQPRGRPVNVHS